MHITFEKDNAKQEINFEGTAAELLEKLNINAETVLVACNDTVVEMSDTLKNTDSILILSVLSGG